MTLLLRALNTMINNGCKEKLIQIGNEITKYFDFLSEIGYDKPEIEYSIAENRDSKISVLWQNKSIDREINVRYINYSDRSFGLGSILCSISKNKYHDQDDYISFEKLLNKNEIDTRFTRINDSNAGNIENAIKLLANYLRKFAFDIISGKAWLNNMYPEW